MMPAYMFGFVNMVSRRPVKYSDDINKKNRATKITIDSNSIPVLLCVREEIMVIIKCIGALRQARFLINSITAQVKTKNSLSSSYFLFRVDQWGLEPQTFALQRRCSTN